MDERSIVCRAARSQGVNTLQLLGMAVQPPSRLVPQVWHLNISAAFEDLHVAWPQLLGGELLSVSFIEAEGSQALQTLKQFVPASFFTLLTHVGCNATHGRRHQDHKFKRNGKRRRLQPFLCT